MRLLDRFQSRAIDASSFNLAEDIWPERTDAGIHVDRESALKLVSVYACVTLISDAISSLPVDLLRRQGDERVEVSRAPQWLTSPNVEQSWREFTDLVLHSLLTHGNAYVSITARDSAGYPQELFLMHPDEIQVRRQSGGGAKEFFHPISGRTFSHYTARRPDGQMVHIMGHTADGLVGLSPIDEARQAIGKGMAIEKYGAKFFGNGSHLNGVVEMPAGSMPTEEQVQALKARWRRMHSGMDRAFEPAVLANGAQFKPITLPNDQAQFIESAKLSVAEIARLYRVPPHLIGDVERSTSWGTGIEQQGIGFVTYTLNPWIVRLEDAFSRLTPRGQYVKWNVSALLRGDIRTRYLAYSTGIRYGFMNRNEVRAYEDLSPVDGLEEFLVPLSMANADGDPLNADVDATSEPEDAP
jgi:HK97 family phage portal protein